MNKRVLGAVGLLLVVGVVVSGASCWKTVRNSSFDQSACTGGKFDLIGTFVPAYDFAELRESSGAQPVKVLQSAGTCASESCKAALQAASSERGWSNASHGRLPGHRYIVAMKGEKALVVDNDAMTIGAALAPIDSPQKAAAVASVARNLSVDCEHSARKVDDGYEVHVFTSSCFGPRDEVIKVAVNGETRVISADSSPGTCVGQRQESTSPKYASK